MTEYSRDEIIGNTPSDVSSSKNGSEDQNVDS